MNGDTPTRWCVKQHRLYNQNRCLNAAVAAKACRRYGIGIHQCDKYITVF
jgi:hypothetical protein